MLADGTDSNSSGVALAYASGLVSEFNAAIQQFPAVILAGMFGFTERAFFDVGADRASLNVAPTVKF